MKLLKRLLPFSVAIAILVLLLRQVPAAEVAQMLAALDWRWILVGFGAYVATNVFRALRYGVFLEQVPSLHMLPEMFAVSFFNNTLPSRTGEVSFPYFMYRRHGVAVGESSAALIVARILDYAAVAALYITFALLNLDELAPGASTAVLVVAIFLLASFCVLLAAPWVGGRLLDGLAWLFSKTGLDGRKVGRVLLRFGRQAVESFEQDALEARLPAFLRLVAAHLAGHVCVVHRVHAGHRSCRAVPARHCRRDLRGARQGGAAGHHRRPGRGTRPAGPWASCSLA